MRQRINPRTPNRGSSGTWEISSEGTPEGDSLDGKDLHQAVPMYNPLNYHPQHPPAPPGSFPLSWHQSQYQQDPILTKFGSSIIPAPRSLSGLKSTDLPSLTPAFIPDSNYHVFVRTGRPVFHNRAKQPGIPLSKVCCAKFCAVYSFVALGFLLFVGLLFDRQPLYIPGALPKHIQSVEGSSRTQVFYSISPSVRLLPASNAYKAAFFYFLTGCFSLAYAYNLLCWPRSKKGYTDIPDTDSTVPTFHVSRSISNGGGDFLLPSNIGGSPARRRTHYFARGSLGDRVVESFRSGYNRVWLYAVATWAGHRRPRRREAGPKEV